MEGAKGRSGIELIFLLAANRMMTILFKLAQAVSEEMGMTLEQY
jgi:hypothetical protein